jgi:hypothetical protein
MWISVIEMSMLRFRITELADGVMLAGFDWAVLAD